MFIAVCRSIIPIAMCYIFLNIYNTCIWEVSIHAQPLLYRNHAHLQQEHQMVTPNDRSLGHKFLEIEVSHLKELIILTLNISSKASI